MIKVFIIAAQTLDGFIAKEANHPAFWTSKEDKRRFVELTKRAGVCIMGSQTFKTLPRPLKERVNIVYTRSQEFEGAETTNKHPIDLVAELEERGFEEVAICGGSQIYTMFLKAGIVDTIYLTVEPVIFGTGISIFNEAIDVHTKLISHTLTEEGTLLLEYKVLNRLI